MTLPDPWPLFQDLRFAGQRSHPRHGACFVAEGRILVEDLLAWGRAGKVEVVAVLAETASAEAVRPLLPPGAELLVATPAEVEALAGFPFHRGLMAAARVPVQPGEERLRACRRLLALPSVADAENLGQLLRTAAALGLDGALLGPGPDPFSRRVVRVSMGTAWKLPLWRCEDPWAALSDWRGADGEVVAAALAESGILAGDWRPAPRTALVLGPEGPGLGAAELGRCDRAVRIAMAPGVDSLNVAAAGAILMHLMAPAGGAVTVNAGFRYLERVERAGATVLEHYAARHPHSTRERWLERIEAGEVELDGLRAGPATVLARGQELAWNRPPWEEPEVDTRFEVLFEDAALLAVAKPGGLPTLPGGGFLENTLLARVRAGHPECSPMHRLGRGTSGIVLFSRTPEAGAALQEAWRAHRVDKRYRALAAGSPSWDALEILAPIGPVPHPWLGTLHAADPAGKPSRSLARVLERRDGTTLLEVDIFTGRPHQIRIHLAHAGHPLAGDPLFGPGGLPREGLTALPGDLGYLLHAERLAFDHPVTGRPLVLRALPPPALRTLDEGTRP